MADDHYSRPTRPNDSLAHARAPQGSQSGGDPLAELARLIGHTNETLSKASATLAKGFPPQSAPYEAEPSYASDRGYAPAPGHESDYEPGYESGQDYRRNYDQDYGQEHGYDPRFVPAHDAGRYDVDRSYAPQSYRPPYGGQSADAGYDQGYARDETQDYGQDRGQRYEQGYEQGYDPYYARDGRDAWPAEDRFSQSEPQPDPYAPPFGVTTGYAASAPVDPPFDPYVEGARDPYSGQRPVAAEPPYRDQAQASAPYADGSYGDTPFAVQPQGGPQFGAPQFASPQYDDKPYPAYDNAYYARQGEGVPPPMPGETFAQQPGAYYDDPSSPGFGAAYYEPEQAEEAAVAPSRRRRNGLATVVAVFALAVVGTAAAFGYRSVFSTSGTRVPPPVIKADTAPSKIVPAVSESAKPIQDRVQTERLVNREEQPLDVNAARASTPRVVFPGPNPVSQPAASSPSTGTVTSSTEPKKIRTVTIRSDQPEAPNVQVDEAAARAAVAPHAASAAAPAAANVPLSLSPQNQPAAPARTASIAPAAVAGGYSVQVTSQRSEREAQAAYATLQSKFPSVLGSRQALIRRADLGDKGIYYRAQIPFGSQGEAADFCTSLRNAGGQCVIQRN